MYKVGSHYINPDRVETVSIEESTRRSVTKYQVKINTASQSIRVSEHDTKDDAEKAQVTTVNRFTSEPTAEPVLAEKDGIISDLNAKTDELAARCDEMSKKLEEIAPYVEQLENDIKAKDAEIEELKRKLESAGKGKGKN